MRQFRLSKIKKKLLISSYAAIAVVFLGIGTYAVINVANTNAEEEELAYGLDDDEWDLGIIVDDGYQGGDLGQGSQGGDPNIDPSEETPASYTPNTPFYKQLSRVENQGSESLCWAYAYTTVIENYFHTDWDIDIELSPKHLDYLLANNFTGDTTNPYWQYVYRTYKDYGKITSGSIPERQISGGATYALTTAISTAKNSLIKDETFWDKIKSANTIEAFNGIDSYSQYLQNHKSGYKGEVTPETILNEENEYTLAEYSVANNYIYYGEDVSAGGSDIQASLNSDPKYFSYNRQHLIMDFKMLVDRKGAVAVGIHYDKESGRCGYVDDAGNFIIIDRTTREQAMRGQTECRSGTGHAVTIIGWDDNLVYYDGTTKKKGAFIIQNSYGEAPGKEYIAYDSAITSFFAVETAWPDDMAWWDHDHVYDYTDAKGHYEKDTTREENYQLVYHNNTNDTNTITPADNELIFEFETKDNATEQIEWVSFSQRFRMYYSKFMAFLSTDDGETWKYIGWEEFEYPGARIFAPDEETGRVSGRFAIKIVYGRSTCEKVPYGDDDWESSCWNSTEGDYTGSALYDKEKVYDLVSVYTSDVNEEDDGKDTAILTIGRSQCDYNSYSHSWYRCALLYRDGVEIPKKTNWGQPDYTIEVPKGTSFTIDHETNIMTLTYPDGTTTQFSAVSASAATQYLNYTVNWSYVASKGTIYRDTRISVGEKSVRKSFNIVFQIRYENNSGGYTSVITREKGLLYGVNIVYNGEIPAIESDQEGITYKWTGWTDGQNTYACEVYDDGEISCALPEVTRDVVYTATFEKVYPDGHTEPVDPENPGEDEQQGSPDDVDKPNNGDNPGGGGSGSIDNPTPSDPGASPSVQPASKSGEKVANTGYGPTEEGFINADIFLTAMSIGTIGFVIYIIKNRRHLRARSYRE
ncbi:hypothetical protein IJI94_00100 [Candidatus Saccharibacteria bacterium]|nr:hypothetical protein [Candidatus Saccharibacteria bacterium]